MKFSTCFGASFGKNSMEIFPRFVSNTTTGSEYVSANTKFPKPTNINEKMNVKIILFNILKKNISLKRQLY
jgi:hypothetical protein